MVDMTELGHNPARIIPAWREFVDSSRRPGRRRTAVRGVGEPVWSGRRDVELVECQLHEALLNVAVAPDEPLWLRCPYDVSRLAAGTVALAQHSHPSVVECGDHRGSTSYGGVAHIEEIFGGELPEPPKGHVARAFTATGLTELRRAVDDQCRVHGVLGDRADDLALAVTELATNSLRHGGGHGQWRSWRDDGALICEISDSGTIVDPLVGRRAPGPDDEGGRGVWMANQLCDLVQVRSSARGTVVRTFVWLDQP